MRAKYLFDRLKKIIISESEINFLVKLRNAHFFDDNQFQEILLIIAALEKETSKSKNLTIDKLSLFAIVNLITELNAALIYIKDVEKKKKIENSILDLDNKLNSWLL